jgi:hypothetical protein
MSAQPESPAVAIARAHVEAWGRHDFDTARTMLAPDVRVRVTTTAPYPPDTTSPAPRRTWRACAPTPGRSCPAA